MNSLACLLLVLLPALANDIPAPPDPAEQVPSVPTLARPETPCKPVMRCPAIWAPVCGCTCDGMYCRTFPNMCQLRSYNCNNTPDYNFNRNGTCDSACSGSR